jgi:hypothetical protein
LNKHQLFLFFKDIKVVTIEHGALDKSSLLFKITLQNTQTVKLMTMNIKTISIYKSNSKCQAVNVWVERTRGLLKEIMERKHLK